MPSGARVKFGDGGARSCYRNRTIKRTLHDVGDAVSERPRQIHLTYSQHYCTETAQTLHAARSRKTA